MELVILSPTDARLTWQGAISLEERDGFIRPWRIPIERRQLFPPVELHERAAMAAGVRLAFHTDSTVIAASIKTNEETCRVDVCRDGRLIASLDVAEYDDFVVDGLPASEKLMELWLPQHGEFWLGQLELSPGASIRPFEDSRPRWITYGSSITQCRAASSPTRTWPATVARGRDLNLTCLGYGGQCHLEPMIAMLIRDLPADFISLCLGINVYGGNTLNVRTFKPAIIGFVQIIREGHPDVPLVVMSPIFAAQRETTPNVAGFTLRQMREEAAAAVEAVRSTGDGNTHYVDGLDIFGAEDAHLLPDDLHPDAEGYKVMGERFLEKVATRVFP